MTAGGKAYPLLMTGAIHCMEQAAGATVGKLESPTDSGKTCLCQMTDNCRAETKREPSPGGTSRRGGDAAAEGERFAGKGAG